MRRKLEMEVANFVCRFGETLVMNDLLAEVVMPAFFSQAVRARRGTEYFFVDQELRYLSGTSIGSLALCCRIVKNTTLKRHQIYSPTKGILADERSLDSAPTAIAVLLLYTHRLLFVKEVPNAPTMQQFGTTFRYRMRDAVLAYHSAAYNSKRGTSAAASKKSISEKFPVPDVSVTPIASREGLKAFVNRFELLNTIKIELAPTNNELDNEGFFEDTREAKEQVGSAKTTLTHHNARGLDKPGVLEHVEAAKQGNLRVRMTGVDKKGDLLKGDNHDFSVRASLGTLETELAAVAQKAFGRYVDLKKEGVVAEGPQQDDYADKLRNAFNLL